MEGYYGMATAFMVKYVIMFIIFGAFLDKSGAGKFFIDLAFALTKGTVGGPAKAAVMGSCLMGSISGSGVANVMMVGSFTIPLMKKVGYRPHVAAAIEAAGSNGGQIMPPVMGSVAFIMAEFTGIPYAKIALISAIPAVMYFLTVYSYVHLEAKKTGVRVIDDQKIPGQRGVGDGWITSLITFSLLPFLSDTTQHGRFPASSQWRELVQKPNRISLKHL
jgi:TRAP-type uncharacterized transport system fused permease subunit